MVLTLDRPAPAHARATVRLATAADRGRLTTLLERTSPESLARRFLTGMAGPPPASLVTYLLLADRPGGAYLACFGDEVIGHGMWVPVRPADVGGRRAAEIALLVRDDHQGRGVANALLDALADGMREAGVEWVQATVTASNRVVNGMIRRRRPGVRPDRDGADLTYLFRTG